jgi:O-antigen/teichoic acid export membrane protein
MLKLEQFNLTQKIAYNAAFSVIARVLEMAIVFVTIRFMTGYLGVKGFGEYGTVLAFVYIFSVLADFGLYSLVVRDISLPDADESKIVNNALTIRLVLGGFVMLSAYYFSLLFPYSDQVRLGILVGAAGYWFLNATQVLMGLFQKHLLMDRVATAEFLSRVAQFVGVVIGVKYNLGFLFIIGTIFWGSLFNYVLVIFYARKMVKIRLEFDLDFWADMLRRAFPLTVSVILVLIYFKMDTIFLSVIKGSDAVGIYSLSYKIMENLIFFPSMVVGLAMPLMSRTVFDDRKQFESIVQRTLNFLLITIVPVVFGIFAVSQKIIFLLANAKPGFRDSIPVLNILAVALGFIFLGALFSNVLIAMKRQKSLAHIYFCGAFFNVASNLFFIPHYSYFGAAFTTLATELLVTSLMIWMIYKKMNFLPSFINLLRAGFAGGIMFVVLKSLYFLNIFYLVAIGAAVYMIVVYAVGGVSKEEMKKLLQKRA